MVTLWSWIFKMNNFLEVKDIYRILKLESSLNESLSNTIINNYCMFPNFLNNNSLYFHWRIGEDYYKNIRKAISQGAFVITSERNLPEDMGNEKIIKVVSVRDSLIKLASYIRGNYQKEIIAVTGSVGKSSVKNILSQVIKLDNEIVTTKGNENSWLGIFTSLCNLNSKIQISILETGASGPKSLSVPIAIVQPTIAVLLEVNSSHLGKYNSFKELLFEKASIIDNLKVGGLLVISNITKKHLLKMDYIFRRDIDVVVIGESIECDFYIRSLYCVNNESIANVIYESKSYTLRNPLVNEANIINSCYAYVVLNKLGYSESKFNSLINFYTPLGRRYERIRVNINNKIFELIDDAYNASPASTIDLLNTVSYRRSKRKIVILGDMTELGEIAEIEHENILNILNVLGFDSIILIGPVYSKCKSIESAKYFLNVQDAIPYVNSIIQEGDLVALKASNSIDLYQIRADLQHKSFSFLSNRDWYIEDEIE